MRRRSIGIRLAVASCVLLTLLGTLTSPVAAATASYTFPTFNSGTITSGSPSPSPSAPDPVVVSLNTTGVPSGDYLFFTVTADFQSLGGTDPHTAYSASSQLRLTDGGSGAYSYWSPAGLGGAQSNAATTLRWSGRFLRPYTAGTALAIEFRDPDPGGYTSQLQNVSLTLYPTPAPSHTFSMFNTGTITSGPATVVVPLNTTGVPSGDYLFFTVTADFQAIGGTYPDAAFSASSQLRLTDGGSSIYSYWSGAGLGGASDNAATTLRWSVMLLRPYAAGTSLAIEFRDPDAGGYTSQLQNVSLTLYAAPIHAFPTFDSGTITSGQDPDPVVVSLGTTGIPAGDYLFFTVTADFQAVGGSDPYSDFSQVRLTDGGSGVYSYWANAGLGGAQSSDPTTLRWSVMLWRPYTTGTPLAIEFRDPDNTGNYTSQLQNVSLTLHSAVGSDPTAVSLHDVRAQAPAMPATLGTVGVLLLGILGTAGTRHRRTR